MAAVAGLAAEPPPLQTAVRVTDADSASVKVLDISAVQNCSVQSVSLMIPSAAPLTAQM